MPANVEIKARVRDFAAIAARAESLSHTPAQVILQEDTFFHTPRGRLKLRQLSAEHGQLVYYERPDLNGPKRSDYFIFETSEPESLKTVLSLALGVRGVIRKVRHLYMVGQTRIHLDQVEGLGDFMELEVVLQTVQSDAEGQTIAQNLMAELNVLQSDLVDSAYIDLLEKE